MRLAYNRRRHGSGASRSWAAMAFVGGLVGGLLAWSYQMQRSRRDLFHKNPLKRLAALGYLGGQAGPENAHLMADYCRWEKHPMLRKRANKLLSRMRAGLV